MKCPKCGGTTTVKDSRDVGEIKRRRWCDDCGHRFSTYELTQTELTRIRRKANENTAAVDRAIIQKAIRSLQEIVKQ